MRTSSISGNDSVQLVYRARAGTKLRLLMAGVPEERIVCEPDEFRAAELPRYTPRRCDVYILYGTDSWPCRISVYDHMKGRRPPGTQGGAERGSGMKVEHPVSGGGEPLRRSDEHPVSAPVLPELEVLETDLGPARRF